MSTLLKIPIPTMLFSGIDHSNYYKPTDCGKCEDLCKDDLKVVKNNLLNIGTFIGTLLNQLKFPTEFQGILTPLKTKFLSAFEEFKNVNFDGCDGCDLHDLQEFACLLEFFFEFLSLTNNSNFLTDSFVNTNGCDETLIPDWSTTADPFLLFLEYLQILTNLPTRFDQPMKYGDFKPDVDLQNTCKSGDCIDPVCLTPLCNDLNPFDVQLVPITTLFLLPDFKDDNCVIGNMQITTGVYRGNCPLGSNYLQNDYANNYNPVNFPNIACKPERSGQPIAQFIGGISNLLNATPGLVGPSFNYVQTKCPSNLLTSISILTQLTVPLPLRDLPVLNPLCPLVYPMYVANTGVGPKNNNDGRIIKGIACYGFPGYTYLNSISQETAATGTPYLFPIDKSATLCLARTRFNVLTHYLTLLCKLKNSIRQPPTDCKPKLCHTVKNIICELVHKLIEILSVIMIIILNLFILYPSDSLTILYQTLSGNGPKPCLDVFDSTSEEESTIKDSCGSLDNLNNLNNFYNILITHTLNHFYQPMSLHPTKRQEHYKCKIQASINVIEYIKAPSAAVTPP